MIGSLLLLSPLWRTASFMDAAPRMLFMREQLTLRNFATPHSGWPRCRVLCRLPYGVRGENLQADSYKSHIHCPI